MNSTKLSPAQFSRLCLLLIIVPLAVSVPAQSADPRTSEILKTVWTSEAGTLEVFDNSETFSQILAINASGEVLGMREVAEAGGDSFAQSYFFCDAERMTTIPLLTDFTNTAVQALSDDGKVVGYASRPPGNPKGSLTAVVWDRQSGKLTNLGHLPGDIGSHAQDISADGTRITGYSTGTERVRPCLWTWDAKSQRWNAEALPTMHAYNPIAVTSGVIIAPHGQRIAGCMSFEIISPLEIDNSLFIWELVNDQWERKLISDQAGRLTDMNNRGEILINLSIPAGRNPAVIDLDGTLRMIDLLPKDVSGEAQGINSDGLIVGLSDDPAGPVGGPEAFLWMDGRTLSPDFAQRAFYSAAYAINERGQIGGLVDVVIKGEKMELAGLKDDRSDDPEIVAKTLGFRWTRSDNH